MAHPKASKDVLLFEDDEADSNAPSTDPKLEKKINKYLEERSSKSLLPKEVCKKGAEGKHGEGEHTGISDDEGDEEGEPDYDVASRMTLKATSEAFLEVMAEARMQYEKEMAEEQKGQATVSTGTAKK